MRRTLKSKRRCQGTSELLAGGRRRRRTLGGRRVRRVRKVRRSRNIKRGGNPLQTASVPFLLLGLSHLWANRKSRKGKKSTRKRSFNSVRTIY